MSRLYSLSFSSCLHPDPSVKKMTHPIMVLWKALNIGIKYIGDFTFSQDHVLLTDILPRVTPNSPNPSHFNHCCPTSSSFPPKIEQRFGVQKDAALKGKFAARRIHHECDPACHPHPTCFASPLDCTHICSQPVCCKTWFV